MQIEEVFDEHQTFDSFTAEIEHKAQFEIKPMASTLAAKIFKGQIKAAAPKIIRKAFQIQFFLHLK